jgi:hypothetical protein
VRESAAHEPEAAARLLAHASGWYRRNRERVMNPRKTVDNENDEKKIETYEIEPHEIEANPIEANVIEPTVIESPKPENQEEI